MGKREKESKHGLAHIRPVGLYSPIIGSVFTYLGLVFTYYVGLYSPIWWQKPPNHDFICILK